MPLINLMNFAEWDFPVFKILAGNDTGNSPGKQAGVLIPVELRPFFPGLIGNISVESPTISTRIDAELFCENRYLSTVSTRYQFQTWGGTRSPEARLTDQLGSLLNIAFAEDIILFQRNVYCLDQYRLTLIRKSSKEYQTILRLTLGKRWGVLTNNVPLSEADLDLAHTEEQYAHSHEFKLIDENSALLTSITKKMARSIIFKKRIISLYDSVCALCGGGLKSPAGITEIDAAHIVPRSKYGSDDARNGLALCKAHHWAFDNGLFGVNSDREVIVPDTVSLIQQNEELASYQGRLIRSANDVNLFAHLEAFKWHRENILLN